MNWPVPTAERPRAGRGRWTHLPTGERWLSLAGGTLALFGAAQRLPARLPLALTGGYLVYRAASGRCPVMAAATRSPMCIRRSVTIARPAAELYEFWRRFENFPRIMDGIESVEERPSGRWHWTARAMGMRLEWDAELVADEENTRIAWQSVQGSDIQTSGEVLFLPAGSRGTVVRVTMIHHPPAGPVGRGLGLVLGEDRRQRLAEALRRFRQLMETGEIPNARRQPAGGRTTLGRITERVAGVGGGRP